MHLEKLNKALWKITKALWKKIKALWKIIKALWKIIKALLKIIKALCRKYNASAWEKYTATWSWHNCDYPGWGTHLVLLLSGNNSLLYSSIGISFKSITKWKWNQNFWQTYCHCIKSERKLILLTLRKFKFALIHT